MSHARGGATSLGNALGLCERCNFIKEANGWTVYLVDGTDCHTVRYITPTGVTHHSTAPPLVA